MHHGSNAEYIDKNNGCILVIWARFFGTNEREVNDVTFGLIKNIETYNPLTITLHGWADWLKDLMKARSLRKAYDLTFILPK